MPRQTASNRQAVSGRQARVNALTLPYTQNILTWSEDGTNAAWSKGTGVTASLSSEAGAPSLLPTADVTKLVYDGSGSAAGGRFFRVVETGVPKNTQCTFAFWARLLSGTLDMQAFNNLGSGLQPFTITSSWEKFSFSLPTTMVGTLTLSIFAAVGDNSTFTAYMTGFHMAKANWLPPYIKTTSSTYSVGGLRNLVANT